MSDLRAASITRVPKVYDYLLSGIGLRRQLVRVANRRRLSLFRKQHERRMFFELFVRSEVVSCDLRPDEPPPHKVPQRK